MPNRHILLGAAHLFISTIIKKIIYSLKIYVYIPHPSSCDISNNLSHMMSSEGDLVWLVVSINVCNGGRGKCKKNNTYIL